MKDKPAQKHLELSEAIHLIRKAKAKTCDAHAFLSEWDDVDFEEELAKFSPMCEVIEATDGLSIVV
ncbi:MAG: hypothetical protein IPO41_16680 [Acidobacteria bacterium]|nr:hypothetical protein [Acidobacteriota bacterium]